jgi:tetratricopeptide (TPR) repeat protein
VERITLRRLTDEEVIRLARAVLPGIERDPRSVQAVLRASGGNPLFALECMRDLKERGQLVSKDDGYVPGPEFDSSAIPRRIQEIIGRRLERLGPREREVLEVAAVQGDFIDPPTVALALELSRLELLRSVRSLHGEHHLLVPFEDGFRFDHPQIREVLLQSLGAAVRQEIHLLLAEALREAYGEDEQWAAAIALHLAEGNRELEAVPHFLRAARAAARAQALADAHRYYERALRHQSSHAPQDELRWEITRELIEIKHKIGDDAGAKKLLDEILSDSPESLDSTQRGWAMISLASAQTRLGAYPAAQERLDSAEALLDPEGSPELRASLLLEQASLGLRQADYDVALRALEQAAKLRGEGTYEGAAVQYKIGQACFLKGDYATAARRFEAAGAWARSAGDLRREAIVLYARSNLEHVRGDPSTARALGERALELAERVGDRRGMAHAANNLALAVAALGDREEAIALHRRSLALKQELRDPQGESNSLHNLADLYQQDGRIVEALESESKALEIKRGIGETARIPPVLVGYGRLLRECGRLDEAAAVLDEARQVATEIAEQDWRVRALIAAGDLAYVEERFSGALELHQQAERIAADKKMRVPRINARQGILRVESRTGRKDDLAASNRAMQDLLAGLDNPQVEVLLAESRALVAWSEGRFDAARADLVTILDYARANQRADYRRWVLRSLIRLAEASGSTEADGWQRESDAIDRAMAERFEGASAREAFRRARVLFPVWRAG